MSADEIREKTGIEQRRYTSHSLEEIALRASQAALDHAGRGPEEIGAVLVCTCTSTRMIPSVATWISGQLGIFQTHASCDIVAACAGLAYGLSDATRILQEVGRPVLLVCVEKFSDKIGNVRPSRMIFGDGAAAIVVGLAPEGEAPDIEYLQTYASGPVSEVNSIIWPNPAFDNNITVYGPEVKSLAGRYLVQMIDELKVLPDPDGAKACLLESIDLIVPHQANKTMVAELALAAGLSSDSLYFNIEKVGNASSASIPLAIHDAVRDGVIRRPMRIFTPGFGAGAVGGLRRPAHRSGCRGSRLRPADRKRRVVLRRHRAAPRAVRRRREAGFRLGRPTRPKKNLQRQRRSRVLDAGRPHPRHGRPRGKEGFHRRCELSRRAASLQVMAGRQDHELGAENSSGQQRAVRGRHHMVTFPADDQGRRSDRAEKRDARPTRDGERIPQRANGVGPRPRAGARRRPQTAQHGLVARSCSDAARGRHEDEMANPRRGVDRELLRDRTSVGEAEHVGGLESGLVEHRSRDGGQPRDRQRQDRQWAAAHTRGIEAHDRVALQRLHERRPALQWPGQAVEQQDRGAGSLDEHADPEPAHTDHAGLGRQRPASWPRRCHARVRT